MWSKTSERAADRFSGASRECRFECDRAEAPAIRDPAAYRMFGGEEDCINPELRNNNALPPIYSQNRNLPIRRALADRELPSFAVGSCDPHTPTNPTGIFRSRSLLLTQSAIKGLFPFLATLVQFPPHLNDTCRRKLAVETGPGSVAEVESVRRSPIPGCAVFSRFFTR